MTTATQPVSTENLNNKLMNRAEGKVAQKPTFSAFITSDAIKTKINEMLGAKDGHRFMTQIISATTNNPDLQRCDHMTILSAALQGESLKLAPSPQLGQYYMVPFEDKKNGRTVATFQIGYKGYIQLAIRSGYYKKINVLAIKEGELIKYDPLNEEIDVILIDDEEVRETAKTIGYYAMFEYTNGFRKTMYWSKTKMELHANKYSQSYRTDRKNKTQYSFWSKDFDGMAFKTMIRQLLSKWGIMSIEMQTAFETDMAVIDEKGNAKYVDNIDDETPITPVNFEPVVDADTTVVDVDTETGEVLNAEEVVKHQEEVKIEPDKTNKKAVKNEPVKSDEDLLKELQQDGQNLPWEENK